MASSRPSRRVEVIVQLDRGTSPRVGRELIAASGGRVTGDLHVINGLAASMTAAKAKSLASYPGVRVVSLNATVKKNSIDGSRLATSYDASLKAPHAWKKGATGEGVGVAVIDTGIAGDLPDFRESQTDSSSRVLATATINPGASSDGDDYGHGTHVAGIIAGNGNNRPDSDPLQGSYVGVAPDANLISIKIDDDQGDASVLDVIYGLQFAVDFKDDYDIRVVNLSLESTEAQSYKTDPLAAAAEAAWFKGIVVVAAAGNRGSDADAVKYAPGNDPYVITVGAVDDQGTKSTGDDALASWSSRGTTQDGFSKPEVVAPGARIVSNLAPSSQFASMCASCVVSGQYIRAGGTSMSAPMVAGAVANLLQLHPDWTPDQVKGVLMGASSSVDGSDKMISLANVGQSGKNASSNEGLSPNELIDPATGEIDYARSRWSRSRWSRSRWSGASFARSRWSCDCSELSGDSVDPTRSRWSRSRWSRSRWSTSWDK
jgi:serine protease AprX